MILRYGGSNYFCFKEDFEIDLRLNKNCPEDISNGKDYSQVMCIKGANAAGKTNALKALSFIASFIASSFNEKPEGKLALETYFGNKMPTHLFCEFRINHLDYRYDLSLQDNKVVDEKLTLISDSNKVLFFRRETVLEHVDDEYSGLRNIPQLRANASIISSAHQHEIPCIKGMYDFFNLALKNVGYSGFKEISKDGDFSKLYHESPEILDFVKEKLRFFDTGIIDIQIDFYENGDGEKVYFPLFCFEINGKIKKLRMHHQSSGTKRLYKLLGYCFAIIHRDNDELPYGAFMVWDELDLHLHSLIIPELIKLFEKGSNTQLIFTCQNDQILDSMGKYRTVLINKSDNESYSYRLDELPSDLLRNNRPITPHYKKGSIGGVPNIG
ncbi:AAA family ATPase [Moritella yayanosii]|uniref:Abortive infection protein n=1 Tax=Moritella yayanosii TaxID=69539 RepID=A0A330LQ92_9GAMM|nr:ATP-binding protein [Moritella yayanosii]SQD78356.1 Abortive infection protein [Moritella yayanosii]